MGYHLNRLDEPALMAGPKPMGTEFGIHHRLESCAQQPNFQQKGKVPECTVTLMDFFCYALPWCTNE